MERRRTSLTKFGFGTKSETRARKQLCITLKHSSNLNLQVGCFCRFAFLLIGCKNLSFFLGDSSCTIWVGYKTRRLVIWSWFLRYLKIARQTPLVTKKGFHVDQRLFEILNQRFHRHSTGVSSPGAIKTNYFHLASRKPPGKYIILLPSMGPGSRSSR